MPDFLIIDIIHLDATFLYDLWKNKENNEQIWNIRHLEKFL